LSKSWANFLFWVNYPFKSNFVCPSFGLVPTTGRTNAMCLSGTANAPDQSSSWFINYYLFI